VTGTAWLVTGAQGQLGLDLQAVLADRPGDSLTALARAELDLTDEGSVRAGLRRWLAAAEAQGRRPVVLNAAAYTAVDAAEEHEQDALVVNGAAPGWLADELAGRGRLVHVSTDYVFDGSSPVPYRVDDPPSPCNAYGRSKLAGEQAVAAAGGDVVVARTAWVYGTHGTNFLKTMLRLEHEQPELRVVDDQTGSPTWSRDLAVGLVAAACAPVHGVLHVTNGGTTTWFGFARRIFELVGADPERVQPTTSEQFPRPAARPAYSVLDQSSWHAAGLEPLPHWEASLRACLTELGALRPA
jgi:dTDP-4-dehydrorhamnose reductase